MKNNYKQNNHPSEQKSIKTGLLLEIRDKILIDLETLNNKMQS